MRLNYIMLPENINRRPLPGYRYRPIKDKKVSGTYTPVSRAGRRVPGEVKVKTDMASNAKKAEERSGVGLFKFIKKLNRTLVARPTLPGVEQTEVEAAPKLVARNEEGASGNLPSQPPQKRPVADNSKPSRCEVISVRVVQRARSNATSSSSRVKLEDVPRPPSIVDSTEDTGNLVGNAVSACAHDSLRQRFTGERSHHHELVPSANTVQQSAPVLAHAVHGIVPPAFPDRPAIHQLANQPNFIFPEHEVPNWRVEPFWLNTGPVPGFPLHSGFETRNDEDFELEHVATSCAYAGMGEPMEVDPEFTTFISNDTYVDLNLERLAIACAYSGMDECMDTTLDDTRGPVYGVVPQMFDQPGFAQYVPPQQAQFELGVGVQPPMYQAVQHLEHQYFVDQDQRLLPPMHAYPINQPFQQEHQYLVDQDQQLLPLMHAYPIDQPFQQEHQYFVHQDQQFPMHAYPTDQPFQQEHFVVNEMFPPHVPVHEPVIQEYFPAAPPFDFDHGIHVQADVPLPLLPIINDHRVDREFELYQIHEEHPVLPIVNEAVGHNERTGYRDVGEAEQLNYFLNGEVEPDHARLFEDLFGNDGGDDDDDDDGDDEAII